MDKLETNEKREAESRVLLIVCPGVYQIMSGHLRELQRLLAGYRTTLIPYKAIAGYNHAFVVVEFPKGVPSEITAWLDHEPTIYEYHLLSPHRNIIDEEKATLADTLCDLKNQLGAVAPRAISYELLAACEYVLTKMTTEIENRHLSTIMRALTLASRAMAIREGCGKDHSPLTLEYFELVIEMRALILEIYLYGYHGS